MTTPQYDYDGHAGETISDEIVEAACRANWDQRTRDTGCGILWDDYEPTRGPALDPYRDGMRAALEAAYPAIRQHVAEQIATKLDDVAEGLKRTADRNRQRSIDTRARSTYVSECLMRMAVSQNNRVEGIRGAAEVAREIGGGQ